MPHIRNIQIRDPFIFREGNVYYLFGSTDKDIWYSRGVGFDMYKSEGNLTEFEGPFPVFRPPAGFWSETNFWAPEVYRYRGEYYMFATFKPKQGRRGTAVLKTPSLSEPFTPWSEGPVTPAEWECLDGTLYVDGEGKPWMIFCHEWQQVVDGEICLLPLRDDLKAAAGRPELLFRASEAPWSSSLKSKTVPGYVTDGPSIYTAGNGALLMLWSSFGPDGAYRIGLAVSESASIKGPWKQQGEPLYAADGGHGMLFHSIDGKLVITAILERFFIDPAAVPLIEAIEAAADGDLTGAYNMFYQIEFTGALITALTDITDVTGTVTVAAVMNMTTYLTEGISFTIAPAADYPFSTTPGAYGAAASALNGKIGTVSVPGFGGPPTLMKANGAQATLTGGNLVLTVSLVNQ